MRAKAAIPLRARKRIYRPTVTSANAVSNDVQTLPIPFGLDVDRPLKIVGRRPPTFRIRCRIQPLGRSGSRRFVKLSNGLHKRPESGRHMRAATRCDCVPIPALKRLDIR